MLAGIGRFAVRRRRLVAVLAFIGFAVAGAFGGGVADELSAGGFEDPTAESTRADRALTEVFDAGQPNLVLVVRARSGSVDDSAVAADGLALTERLAAMPGIDQAASYWSLGAPPPLRGDDATRALVLARIGGSEDAQDAWIEEHRDDLAAGTEHLSVGVGGFAEVFREVGTTIESDLARAEGIALPITMLLLVVVFGSVVAAGLPIAIGVLAIIGTFFVLFVIAQLTQVSIFALNLTTAMGLGLAIDYSLFVVSRYREELAASRQRVRTRDLTKDDEARAVRSAIERTVQTAGRTVLFSAGAVAASLAALLVFPLAFLRSFAYAGIAVVAVASVASVVVLPAVLALLGPRIDRLSVRRNRQAPQLGEGAWHRIAVMVMGRPWTFAVGVTLVLVVLGLPFLRIELGLPDDRVLPPTSESRTVHDELRQHFASEESRALHVVGSTAGDPAAMGDAIHSYATRLSLLDGVSRVDAVTGFYVDGQHIPPTSLNARYGDPGGTFLSVVPSVEPYSTEGVRLVHDIRAAEAPFAVEVGGFSAQLVDAKASILGRVPLALGLIGVVTFIMLFLMFGSILVPIKAVVLNLLSLTATFGAMVWIFQDGNLAGVLNFTPTGMIDLTTPILMFCIAFGLSMDYEVFLLSRVKEEYDLTGDNDRAVAVGLERTGRIVTAAAALLAVVFIAMTTSQVTFIKLFGLGLTMAVLMDATLVRATLVPAFMKLAGEANWWAPAPLRRVHERWGFSEHGRREDRPVPVIPALEGP